MKLYLPGKIGSHQKKKKSKFINGDSKWWFWVTNPETVLYKGACLYLRCELNSAGLGDMPRCVLCLLPLWKHGAMILSHTSFPSASITIGQKSLQRKWSGFSIRRRFRCVGSRVGAGGGDRTIAWSYLVPSPCLSVSLFLYLTSTYHFCTLERGHSP